MFWIELCIVLSAIFIGARLGGIGLGVMGGIGLCILTFGFKLQPTSPPIDVMLMIVSVITAAASMQAAGGLDYLVQLAEKILRKHPSRITFYGPIVTYLFTLVAGTGHVCYSVLPVIAEVSRETGVRPERPMSIAVIASQQAITASPISAATVALLGMLTPYDFQLIDILMISIPSTFFGVLLGAFVSNKIGKELKDDKKYQELLASGAFETTEKKETKDVPFSSKLSVVFFLLGALAIVLFGSIESLRPTWEVDGVITRLGMPETIEMVMMGIAALILIFSKVDISTVAKGSVFSAGMQAVIAIFGIAWMGDTFFAANMEFLGGSIKEVVTAMPWLFALALFVLSILLYSQAATVRALMPLGIALGIPAPALIAMFPAVNGYFFIPNYPTVVAAINFDRTQTTRIGKYLLNHSFMIPGMVATMGAISMGFLLTQFLF